MKDIIFCYNTKEYTFSDFYEKHKDKTKKKKIFKTTNDSKSGKSSSKTSFGRKNGQLRLSINDIEMIHESPEKKTE